MKICSTFSGATPARSTAALTAAAPRAVALTGDSAPWKPPIGVRAKEQMTTGSAAAVMTGVSVSESFRGGIRGGEGPLASGASQQLATLAGEGQRAAVRAPGDRLIHRPAQA